MIILGHNPKDQRGGWADRAWTQESGRGESALRCSSPVALPTAQAGGGARALAGIMQKAGEDFVILGNEERCCGLYAFDLGFRREFERLKELNLATIDKAGINKVVVACGSCLRIWREYEKTSDVKFHALHGVEYVHELMRVGPAKIFQTR